MLLAHLVEAFWFPGQTFSNGQFSCRVAPLCLLGLEVRTGRWSAVWAWIVVATLFQTCFRPPKMNAWCWWIRVCFWVLPSEASQRAWRCRRHGGGMMCIFTYRPIYLSICLNQYDFQIFHIYLEIDIEKYFSIQVYSATTVQPITGQHFEFSAFWGAIRNAELRPQWHRIPPAFANYPPFMPWHKGTRKMIWWMCALRHGSGPSCF